MPDWITWVCDHENYITYDALLEDYSAEQLDELYDEYLDELRENELREMESDEE